MFEGIESIFAQVAEDDVLRRNDRSAEQIEARFKTLQRKKTTTKGSRRRRRGGGADSDSDSDSDSNSGDEDDDEVR